MMPSFPPIVFAAFAAAAIGALSVIFLASFLLSDKLTERERRHFVVLGGFVSVLAAAAITLLFSFEGYLHGAVCGAVVALVYSGVSSLLLKRRDSLNPSAGPASRSSAGARPALAGAHPANPIVLVAVIQGIASIIVALIALLK